MPLFLFLFGYIDFALEKNPENKKKKFFSFPPPLKGFFFAQFLSPKTRFFFFFFFPKNKQKILPKLKKHMARKKRNWPPAPLKMVWRINQYNKIKKKF